MFAEPRSRTHKTYCVRLADVAVFRGRVQLGVAQWSTADQLRGSNNDQLRKRAVVSPVWILSPKAVRAGGGAVGLVLKLMSCYFYMRSSALLVAYGSGGGRRSMWQKEQATVALREDFPLAGVRSDKYALHSFMIGGATHLSAVGGSSETLLGEGRWASDAYKAYACRRGKYANRVANVIAQDVMGSGIQPRQGAHWG